MGLFDIFRRKPTGQGDDDVFRGTRRQITLPPGWVCDHSDWRWTEISRDESEGFITFGLEVFTRHEHTGEVRWRPVGQGTPMYGGHIWAPGEEPDIPGSWRQVVRRLPMDGTGQVVDPEGQLGTCRA